ncbi:MAG TPA: hypothetical protein VEV86_00495, partial [Vicinamibacterales bacterium]|nr:hypothetical protein [Vicinamibacterales bacterium]
MRIARACQRGLERGIGHVLSERTPEAGCDDRLAGVNVVHGNASNEAIVAVNVFPDDRDATTK